VEPVGVTPPSLAHGVALALPRVRTALFVMALGLFWLARLDALPLLGVDEGAFAEAAREMLESGDWGHTTLDGADRFDQPILVTWLQAAAVSLFGAGEFALRLPSALCGWAWCLALAGFAAPRWGRGAALAAALLLAGALGPALVGRAATADALSVLLLTLAGLDLWRHLASGSRAPLRRAAVWTGLGLLAQGPVALLVPGAALLLWALSGRAWGRLRTALGDGPAWALGAAVALPWYAYALGRHGWAFVDGVLLRHDPARFVGPLEGQGGGTGLGVLAFPLLLLPWAPVLWPLAAQVRRTWSDPLSRYLALWAGSGLVWFSLAGHSLPHAALCAASPVVLLTARWLPSVGRATVLAVAAVAVLMVALGPASGALAGALAAGTAEAFWIGLLDPAALPAPPAPLPAALVAAAIVVVALWRQVERCTRVLAISVLAIGYSVAQTGPWWGRALAEPVRALASVARAEGRPLVPWRLQQPSLGFYASQPAPRRGPQTGDLALVRVDRLSSAERAALDVLAERRGHLLVRQP